MGKLLDGRLLADELQVKLREDVQALSKLGTVPTLVVIIIGENKASQVYVRNKALAAQKIGIHSIIEQLAENVTEAEVIEKIGYYNQSSSCHGILVQLPLPKHIDEKKILLTIDPKKDVDGFHPVNMGQLLIGNPTMIPCTPFGIMKMFEMYHIDLSGKQAVVIGRSNIVGKPMAQLLLMKDATVTMAHSKTHQLPDVAREADILVVAIGQGQFVTKEFIKPGAVVIDVGMNHNREGKLIGDVKFDEVSPLTSYITPVPKGVGPMTITMLMSQTVEAAKRQK